MLSVLFELMKSRFEIEIVKNMWGIIDKTENF